jgi:hypothetical protein
MRQMKSAILLLIIDLTVFFNIKQFNLGGENAIDIQPLFYAVGFVSVVLILLVPLFRQMNIWLLVLLWNAIGFVLRMIFVGQRPLFGDVYTYLSISEAVLVSLTAVLAQRVACYIYDFEKAIENITLDNNSGRVKHRTESLGNIQDELTRSRRYNHPLSLILVEPEQVSIHPYLHRVVAQVQESMMERYVNTSLGKIISDLFRRTDLVIIDDDRDRFIVLCPETEFPQAQILAERIHTLIGTQLGVEVNCGISSFPAEALTFEELVHQAEQKLVPPSTSLPVESQAVESPQNK